jgi:hypothetical protein
LQHTFSPPDRCRGTSDVFGMAEGRYTGIVMPTSATTVGSAVHGAHSQPAWPMPCGSANGPDPADHHLVSASSERVTDNAYIAGIHGMPACSPPCFSSSTRRGLRYVNGGHEPS